MGKGVNILYVDDNFGARRVYKLHFDCSGCPINAAPSFEKAISMMMKKQYGFITTDYNLGSDKNGIDVIKKAVEFYDGKCKIFLISALLDWKIAEESKSIGAIKACNRMSFDLDKFIQ